MGVFAANPDAMRQKGIQIGDIAVEFQTQIDKIYETLSEMYDNGLTSPAALQIVKGMYDDKPILDNMKTTIDKYGAFFSAASSQVQRDEEDRMDAITSAGGFN